MQRLSAILNDAQSDFSGIVCQLLLRHMEHHKEIDRQVSEFDVAEVQRPLMAVVYRFIEFTSAILTEVKSTKTG